MAYNLTNQYISQSYQQLLQVSSSRLMDGTGSVLSTLYLNNNRIVTDFDIAAISATTSSIDALNTFTGSAVYRSGSFTGSFTGSFLGAVSTASYAFTSSVSITSSFSIFSVSSSRSVSSFNSDTASFVANAISSSYALTASSAVSSSFAVSSSHTITASYALNAEGAGTGFPFSGSARITGSLGVTGSINATSITSSLFGTGSWAVSASRAVSAAVSVSSSYSTYAETAGVVALIAPIVQSGSIGSSNQLIGFFAGGGQTAVTPPHSLTVTVPSLINKILGTNVFISTTMTGSDGDMINNYVGVEAMDTAGAIRFISSRAVQFTFTGIYV